jgi:hypothetical protein
VAISGVSYVWKGWWQRWRRPPLWPSFQKMAANTLGNPAPHYHFHSYMCPRDHSPVDEDTGKCKEGSHWFTLKDQGKESRAQVPRNSQQF